jgi:hypothetical protein
MADRGLLDQLQRLREFQSSFGLPTTDAEREAPAKALHSLHEAVRKSPLNYRSYLEEAVLCYEVGAYRGAVLMVWSAVVEHLYGVIESRLGGLKAVEQANEARFRGSSAYKKVRKKNDLLYLGDKNFLLICEDAGVFNRNARSLLEERLALRNRCGHPTGYAVGREETVVFIESLINNVLSGAMIDWR